VPGVVVREFRQWEELDPIILFVVAKGAEVLFHGLILTFRLAVGLWMECGGESVIDAQMRADSSPKSAGELRVTVGDDIIWYTMFADQVLEKHTCQLR